MRKFSFLLFVFFPLSNFAQNAYFQQDVNYEIHVTLDDSNHILRGNIQMNYKNNSPNTLDTLWFLLMPNAYKNDSSALAEQLLKRGETKFYTLNENHRGFIDSLDFTSKQKKLKWEFGKNQIDVCYVILNQSLKAGESVRIETTFKVKIPVSGISRMGYDSLSYQISQWFPKPAVYDKYGWHPISYLDKGEFYSEFGTFDVFITLPKNFIVAATGDLVDNSDELSWLVEKSKKSRSSFKTIFSSKEFKTLHFHQSNIHDFAWFASKYYSYRKGNVTLKSGKKIETNVYFLSQSDDLWENVIEMSNRSIKYLSDKIGEYPYNQVSVVQGDIAAGGGMEYPTITVIGDMGSKESLEETTVHEIAHNWFYGILGFNERDNPWMDEGITTFYENRYSQFYNSKSLSNSEEVSQKLIDVLNSNLSYEDVFTYFFIQSRGLDQKNTASSSEHSDLNYYAIVYYKTALCFKYLKNYLGDSAFDSIMQGFYNEWKFKHPQPEDLRAFFEEKSAQNLDWFFDGFIGSYKFNDYAIKSVKRFSSDSIQITIKNKGQINAPIQIVGFDKNQMTQINVWEQGFFGKKKFTLDCNSDLKKIEIDPSKNSLDVDISNQSARTNGIFKTWPKYRLKFLYSLPKTGVKDFYYSPVIGYNEPNKFMLGAIFYNDILMERKWEYRIMPMWSKQTQKLVGEFGLYHNLHHLPLNIRKMSFGIIGKKYGYLLGLNKSEYLKIMPEICFYFKSPHDNNNIIRNLKLSFPIIYKQFYAYQRLDSATVLKYLKTENYNISHLQFQYKNNRKINPYSVEVDGQYHSDFIKLGIDARYRITYKNVKSGLDIRFFAGKIINAKNSMLDYGFKMSNFSGMDDYMFESTHLARGVDDGYLAHSIILGDGGFNIQTPVGRTINWLTAINLKSSIYAVNFLKFYLNAGTYYDAKNAFMGSKILMYEGGIVFSLMKDVCEIFVPIVYSTDIKQALDINNQNTFAYKIRFTLKLESANPFKYLKEVNL